jgi:hypothetical protein
LYEEGKVIREKKEKLKRDRLREEEEARKKATV